jgi:RNA polymerase sigma-70 factor (ECF subfamily)
VDIERAPDSSDRPYGDRPYGDRPSDSVAPPPAKSGIHKSPASCDPDAFEDSTRKRVKLTRAERAKQARRVHQLFSENYKQIWRLLRRFGVPELHADDAAQKVFLILAERIADVREGSERAFLYGTAFRVATGFRRITHREKPTDLADEQKCSLPRPDELTDRKRARDLLDRLLAQMDDDLKTVFILYELEGFTTPEISDFLEVPLGTAASRLRRARESFRTLVADAAQTGVTL